MGIVEQWRSARTLRRSAAAEEREEKRRFQERHCLLLCKAAGIAWVQVVCHEDTWRFVERTVFPPADGIVAIWLGAEDFPQERIVRGAAGMVTVTVSGPHLVRCLTMLYGEAVGGPAFPSHPARYAMATCLYASLGEMVERIDPSSCRGGIPPLVIDAGLKADDCVPA